MAPQHPVLRPAPEPAARRRTSLSRLVRRVAAVAVAGVLAGSLLAAPARADNPVTPGNFTGYGFDQCLAPTQQAMTAWLNSSPFWAVGIYISGDSRGCRNQPNLTSTWVTRQLQDGWRLLPITLGPQASCNPRYPRYGDDETVNPSSANGYRAARLQGRAEAASAVAAAKRLGIRAGSTLWYDMEAYDIGKVACRESALSFTSGWTDRIHELGYVSGVYSSAGSHIKALDDARATRPGTYTMPDRIWFARWDGVPTTSTPYVRAGAWLPGGRVKQYRGDHKETHGGVTIDIDSNWLDVGKGSKPAGEVRPCGGVNISYQRYPRLVKSSTGPWIRAAQCLLRNAGHDRVKVTGTIDLATQGVIRRYRVDRGWSNYVVVDAKMWTALLSRGWRPLAKYGAAGEHVRRIQRATNAATGTPSPVTGTFAGDTAAAVKRYQRALGLPATGVVTPAIWTRLQSGRL